MHEVIFEDGVPRCVFPILVAESCCVEQCSHRFHNGAVESLGDFVFLRLMRRAEVKCEAVFGIHGFHSL